MKRHTVIVLLALSIILGQSIKAEESRTFINPTPGRISIMAVSPFPDGVTPSKQGYQEIVSCGFNLVTSQGSLDFFKKQFSLMEGLDLKYIVSSQELRTSKRSQLVNGLKSYPQLGGWLFKDEPKYDDLKTLSDQYNALYKDDGNRFIYMNLIGGLSKPFTGNNTSYGAYLNQIQKLFNPPIWSFDLYPIYEENGIVKVRYDQWYTVLESISAMAKQTKKPFWSFCLGMSFKGTYGFYPAATEAYLNFEAFTALAYGAQGIVYWTYGLRKSNQAEKFYSALVNLDGKKTQAWYAAQKVNAAIKKYNDVFYGCNVRAVKHTGSKTYKGTTKLAGGFGLFKSITGNTDGVMASYINNKGNTYTVIINHSVTTPQNVKFRLWPDKKVSLISDNNQIYTSEREFSITLPAGGYLIFKDL